MERTKQRAIWCNGFWVRSEGKQADYRKYIRFVEMFLDLPCVNLSSVNVSGIEHKLNVV